MKNKTILFLLIFIFVPLFTFSQGQDYLRDFLERWENSKNYLLAVAEAMPEDGYAFKPSPEEKTFGEQLLHIAVVMDWHAFSKFAGSDGDIRWGDFTIEGKNKTQIIDILKTEFDRSAALIAGFNAERLNEKGKYAQFTRSRRQFLMLLADHVSHHRGQLVVYLRIKGIQPPDYINFQ